MLANAPYIEYDSGLPIVSNIVCERKSEEREKTKYIIDSVVEMEINYLFTNDKEYLDNFTAFIPKHQKSQQMQNNAQNNQGQNKNNQDINEIKPQPPVDAKKLFIKEIRNRIEAYFKLIVRNLRDMIPKIMGNYLIKEIEENMQLKLYNKLYNAKEMTDLLNEPESVAERRKELNDMIKVMRNAQKIIRRDPDLMTVMHININDSDINNTKDKKEDKKKEEKKEPEKPAGGKGKKSNLGNLFG